MGMSLAEERSMSPIWAWTFQERCMAGRALIKHIAALPKIAREVERQLSAISVASPVEVERQVSTLFLGYPE